MKTAKRYRQIRNTLALMILGVSAASLAMPYKHVASAANEPIRTFYGYEMVFSYVAVFFIVLTIALFLLIHRKWAPLFIVLPALANIATLYCIRWEVHISIKGFVKTHPGIGFYLLTFSILLLFIIACANLLRIFTYEREKRIHPELVDDHL